MNLTRRVEYQIERKIQYRYNELEVDKMSSRFIQYLFNNFFFSLR